MDPMWALIASFFLILLVLVLINAKVNGGFKVETSWIAVALSPTIIWLLTTGQLAELSGFGFAFKLREASAKPFSLSLEGAKIEPALVPLGEKGGMAMLQELEQRRIAALTLQGLPPPFSGPSMGGIILGGPTNFYNVHLHGGDVTLRSWTGHSRSLWLHCSGGVTEGRNNDWTLNYDNASLSN